MYIFYIFFKNHTFKSQFLIMPSSISIFLIFLFYQSLNLYHFHFSFINVIILFLLHFYLTPPVYAVTFHCLKHSLLPEINSIILIYTLIVLKIRCWYLFYKHCTIIHTLISIHFKMECLLIIIIKIRVLCKAGLGMQKWNIIKM